MKDRQRLFLDRVVKIIVEDTIIDYDMVRVQYPFSPLFPSFSPPYPSRTSFFNYCRNNYGLTGNEIEYVWNEYKSIINDKIKNNGR